MGDGEGTGTTEVLLRKRKEETKIFGKREEVGVSVPRLEGVSMGPCSAQCLAREGTVTESLRMDSKTLLFKTTSVKVGSLQDRVYFGPDEDVVYYPGVTFLPYFLL